MTHRPVVVLIDGRMLYSRSGPMDLQCVARTSRGQRCRNWVESGQIANWAEVRSKLGRLTAYDMREFRGTATEARWLAQHCETHDGTDVDDFEAPEWEESDPAGVHSEQVKPWTDEWQVQ